jgi:muramoyltetrapeptide carboxypeptidase LdcA involved in peptidoglycan recycling
VADIHTAFADKSVKAVLTIIGGANSNQLVKFLDYDLIKNNPKIFCGFSDITALHSAIRAKTGLETYYGPHFSSLGMKLGCDYTFDHFVKMLVTDGRDEVTPSEIWSDDLWFLDQDKREFEANEGYWNIHDGSAQGEINGGNLCTFNLLLGTEYRPEFKPNTILFIEDTEVSPLADFERNLQALICQPDFKNVKALVIGRFQKGSKVTREGLEYILNTTPELKDLPILANVDFGHSSPLLTIPLGGTATLANGKLTLEA